MQKIILTVLFCSVVSMANNEQNNNNEMTKILTKTLTQVKGFKEEKNKEIKKLREEVSRLKKKLKSSKNKLKSFNNKQNKEIKKVKKALKLSQKKNLKYEKSQLKKDKQLQVDKQIIKDLHFLIKQKNEVEMDEYALGRYYFNL